MKKQTLIIVAAGLVAAGSWAGRAAWRASKDIVTLHVRNATLASVIASLKRQTWENIVADGRLNTLITLNVDDMPLIEVLDRIGEQAGGLATVVHAVYDSRPALEKLAGTLRQGTAANAEGWTHIAPHMAVFNETPHSMPPHFESGTESPGPGKKQFITMDRDVVARHNPKDKGANATGGSGTVIRIRGGAPGSGDFLQEEVITPERIVLETKLAPRLKTHEPVSPNRESALSVAQQVEGHCTTIYTLRKSFAASMGGNVMRRARMEAPKPGSGKETAERSGPPSMAAIERDARRADLSRFMNLTPEQRAQRTRERREVDVRGEP